MKALFPLLRIPVDLAQDNGLPLTARERAVHLLSRMAYGPRPGDIALVFEMGEEAWIDAQLEPGPHGPPALRERLAGLATLQMSPLECRDHVEIPLGPDPTREETRERNEARKIPSRELTQAVVLRAIYSDRQLEEVLCDFWRNHFNVSFTKAYPAAIYIPDYERTVIQAHVLGTFPDMLRASAHHPAMLNYLDNELSRRPPSKQKLAEIERKVRRETGSRERGEEAALIASRRGLNENYARELMELHTLGVDRGYRQKDVVAVAEALTGWGIDSGKEGTLGFRFRQDRHIAGNKEFLGHILRKDKEKGPAQGERVLEVLGRHKTTAEFIAIKLVRYFVDDEPPQQLIDKVAKVYKKKDGDIPAMVRAILVSKEFWSRAHYRSKFKTPYEFVASAVRVTGAEVDESNGLHRALASMGQPTYHCDDPTGWYDTADAWLDPGVMARRWQFALELAAGKVKGVRVPDSVYAELKTAETAQQWMQEMVAEILPGGASSRTLAMLNQVVRRHQDRGARSDLEQLGPKLLGLTLGSPEFQRQ